MDLKTVRYETQESIATITLSRADQYNAINADLGRELALAVREAARQEAIRAVLIIGSGRAFSAGGDVRAMAEAVSLGTPAQTVHAIVEAAHLAVTAIREIPKPVVAALNGVAAGAGLGLALACDLRIAAAGTQLLTAFLGVGVSPDSSTSFFLPRLVGLSKATELFFLNRPLSAEEAHQLGLVCKVVAPEKLQEESLTLARTLAQGPTLALGRAKQLLLQSFSHTLPEHLTQEAYLVTASSLTEDFREGVTAFVGKRKASFKGK